METIAKLLKEMFFSESGEVDKTAVGKFKNSLLLIILGAAITIAALVWWASDEDETDSAAPVECVDEL